MTKKQNVQNHPNLVNRFIRQRLSKTKRIVHGARAQNVQLPSFLKRPTRDWDIFAKNPKKAATNMEKFLDGRFKEDTFSVKKGATKKLKVHKVIRNSTGENVVDYSIPDRRVPVISKRRINFAALSDQKKRSEQNLKKPSALFRRDKDRDLLKRIKRYEKQLGREI